MESNGLWHLFAQQRYVKIRGIIVRPSTTIPDGIAGGRSGQDAVMIQVITFVETIFREAGLESLPFP
jgi:hypothetical protein